MSELAMQFPRLTGKSVYDGVWHAVEPITLWSISECNRLYLLEFIDKKYGTNNITFLIRSHSGFSSLPLIHDTDVMRDFEISLKSASASILPSQIEALSTSYDWADMALRLSRNDADAQDSSEDFSVSTRRLGEDPRYTLTAMDYGVITLFIEDTQIYLGKFEFNGMSFKLLSPDEVMEQLSKYCVIWRKKDFRLIVDVREISDAITAASEKVSTENGVICDVLEVVVPSSGGSKTAFRGSGEWPYKTMPVWLRDKVHRYDVYSEQAN